MSRRPKYPWRRWMDGELHRAYYGVDFTCEPSSFINYLHTKAATAKGRDLKVCTSIHRTENSYSVEFRFYDPEEYDTEDDVLVREA